MPPSDSSSLSRSRGQLQQFLLGHGQSPSPASSAFQLAKTRDRARDGAPVGQGAAEPAVIDVVLGAALGGGGDGIRSLTLGADEQHATAGGGDFTHLHQGLVQERNRLRQVDDVDVRARTEDVAVHLRVPAVRLVAEVGASFQELTHGEFGKSHRACILFPVEPPRTPPFRTISERDRNGDLGISPQGNRTSTCGMARQIGANGSKCKPCRRCRVTWRANGGPQRGRIGALSTFQRASGGRSQRPDRSDPARHQPNQ